MRGSVRKLRLEPMVLRLTIVIALLLLGQSCGKVSHNGDLDGMWRVLTVENLTTGEVTYPNQHFYCFYLHTANLTKGVVCATANMIYDYPKLILDFPYNSAGQLDEWGIYSNYVEFEILELNSREMTMRSTEALVAMRKF